MCQCYLSKQGAHTCPQAAPPAASTAQGQGAGAAAFCCPQVSISTGSHPHIPGKLFFLSTYISACSGPQRCFTESAGLGLPHLSPEVFSPDDLGMVSWIFGAWHQHHSEVSSVLTLPTSAAARRSSHHSVNCLCFLISEEQLGFCFCQFVSNKKN